LIEGKFSDSNELIFEIDFVAEDSSIITVDALFDTGFTGWLAVNTQDAVSLGWQLIDNDETRLTATGEAQFNVYARTINLDGQDLTIPVVAGDDIAEVLLGLPWLLTRKLVVDFPSQLLTLGG
jgi:clan AA aspartic protease